MYRFPRTGFSVAVLNSAINYRIIYFDSLKRNDIYFINGGTNRDRIISRISGRFDKSKKEFNDSFIKSEIGFIQ